jgi:hypothetical protein
MKNITCKWWIIVTLLFDPSMVQKKYKGNGLWMMFSNVIFWSNIVCTYHDATTSPSRRFNKLQDNF